jgi:hypothetical protein
MTYGTRDLLAQHQGVGSFIYQVGPLISRSAWVAEPGTDRIHDLSVDRRAQTKSSQQEERLREARM